MEILTAKQAITEEIVSHIINDGKITIIFKQEAGRERTATIDLKQPSPVYGVAAITAKIATERLMPNLHPNQRTRSKEYVGRLRDLMINGEWKVGEPVLFDCEGFLVDGQNRLQALIEAQAELDREGQERVLSIDFAIGLGLSEDILISLNSGKPRAPNHSLKSAGVDFRKGLDEKTIVAAIKHLATDGHAVANEVLYDLANKYMQDVQDVMELAPRKERNLTNACIVAAITKEWLGQHDIIKARIALFGRTFFSGILPDEFNPDEKHLYDMVLNCRRRIQAFPSLRSWDDQRPAMLMVKTCLQAFLNSKVIKHFKPRK